VVVVVVVVDSEVEVEIEVAGRELVEVVGEAEPVQATAITVKVATTTGAFIRAFSPRPGPTEADAGDEALRPRRDHLRVRVDYRALAGGGCSWEGT
jgi:hypothetical protein